MGAVPLPIVTPAEGERSQLFWPPNRTRTEGTGGPQIQVNSEGRAHCRVVWIDLHDLMKAIVTDPLCRAELDVVLAEARLAEVRSKVGSADG